MTLSLICAIATNGAIGKDNNLLYHLRSDLQRFKQLTSGKSIIMGRKTFESLPKGALPMRRNIIVSRTLQEAPPNTEIFTSLDEALAACEAEDEVFIIGGAQIYALALPNAQKLYLTHIHHTPENADTFFPAYQHDEWRCVEETHHHADEQNDQDFTFATYQRKHD